MITIKSFAREAAMRYLQSAVFIDDNIFDQSSGMPVDVADLPKSRKPIFERQTTAKRAEPLSTASGKPGEQEQPYHPKDLVSSFAQAGIICALYEPPKGFSTSRESEIFRLCERTDIIILDWDFSGDNGKKALDLISNLVKQSHHEFPHHARLLSVYTADPSLVAVANQIADRLRNDGFQAQPEQSQCRIKSGAIRLVVFGKDLARIGADEQNFTLKEKHLAGRVVDEFADMNAGILPSYALHGMAAVRHNSKRVLDRFHGEMDAAFLLHRAMLLDTEDALEQLPELLAEELLAIVEGEHSNVSGLAKCFAKLAANVPLGQPVKQWCDKNGKPLDAIEAIRSLLRGGVGGLSDKDKEVKQINGIAKKMWRGIDVPTMQDLQSVIDPGKAGSCQRLAALFATRTQYNSKNRELQYGTIVRHREDWRRTTPWVYSFCFMPLCDAIRLQHTKSFKSGKPIPFPFWRLKEDVYGGTGGSRRGIVVQTLDGTFVELSAGGKPRDMLWQEEFHPNKSSGTVLAARRRDGRFVFSSDEGHSVEWVGQLKPLHAQRIAHDIGQSFSRVGLVEAEWLRLLCDQ